MRIEIPASDGKHYVKSKDQTRPGHQMTMFGAAGTVTVRARAVGGAAFEDVPDGTFDLANPKTVQFTFVTAEFEFEVTGSSGDKIVITDVTTEV